MCRSWTPLTIGVCARPVTGHALLASPTGAEDFSPWREPWVQGPSPRLRHPSPARAGEGLGVRERIADPRLAPWAKGYRSSGARQPTTKEIKALRRHLSAAIESETSKPDKTAAFFAKLVQKSRRGVSACGLSGWFRPKGTAALASASLRDDQARSSRFLMLLKLPDPKVKQAGNRPSGNPYPKLNPRSPIRNNGSNENGDAYGTHLRKP
jgi:hypothetical protein